MTESRWDLIPTRRRRGRFLKLAVAVALIVGLTPALTAVSAVSPPTAGATHFRANQINWHTTSTPGEVEFHLTGSWRIGYFFWTPPSVGDTFSEPCLNFGDGTSDCPTFVVTSVDAANDVFSAESHASHLYATSTSRTVSLSGCCRLSAPLHRNNPDGSVLLQSVVDFAATSASPVSQVSPIVDCGLSTVCSFQIPATDSDGQGLRFRFAGANEAGSGFAQPFGATVNQTTGQYTWDTTGASLNTNGDSFFSTQVIVENVVGTAVVATTPVDFFIRVTDTPNLAPVFQSPTPADGTELTGSVGSPVTFDVAASDGDTADTVTLSVLGVPSGATFTTASGNPATGTFNWTPPAEGDTILTLLAQDQFGRGAVQRSITLRIDDFPPAPQAPPVFDPPTPANGATLGPLPVGSAFDIPVAASDPNAADHVTLGWSGPGGILLEAAGSNPVAGTLNLEGVAPGTHQITLTATDPHGNTATPRTITAKITNAAPAFVSPTPNAGTTFTAYRGTAFTIPLAVDDPDPDLRPLTLSVVSGPSGGTIGSSTDPAADGAFKWTPTALGSFGLTVKVQDAWGAFATRQFSLKVLNRAPEFIAPSPAAGEIFDLVATGRRDITVKASDLDPETVRLATVGLPSGATYSYVGGAPGNPSEAILSWTPSTAGSRQVTLSAYDPQNLQAPSRTITLRVLHAPTALTAHPAVARVSTKPAVITKNGVVLYDVYFPYLSAVLKTDTTAPQPNKALAGKVVKFYAGTSLICQGTTDSTGQAFCQGAVASSQASVLLAQGYRAVFAGDATYNTVSASGTLVQNTLQ